MLRYCLPSQTFEADSQGKPRAVPVVDAWNEECTLNPIPSQPLLLNKRRRWTYIPLCKTWLAVSSIISVLILFVGRVLVTSTAS